MHVTWNLTSLLGLTEHCGELRDSSTLLPPSVTRDLLAGGTRVRRMVIDPDTGEQLDLTPVTWPLPASDGRAHRQPVVLTITTTARWDALPTDVRGAVDANDNAQVLRELLDYPLTAETLDHTPDVETPSPALAEFTASRAGHPVNSLERELARRRRAAMVRASPRQRATRENRPPAAERESSDPHRIKTFTDWTVRQINRSWEWTSPTGRSYTIEPHDYRLGP